MKSKERMRSAAAFYRCLYQSKNKMHNGSDGGLVSIVKFIHTPAETAEGKATHTPFRRIIICVNVNLFLFKTKNELNRL